MINTLPDLSNDIKTLLDNITDEAEKLLGGNFVGLYIHGSIAMGCFNPLVSDIDFLVVVRKRMTVEEKRDLAQILLNTKVDVPRGIEMSVVQFQFTKNPVFPTPFEFHFSKKWEEKYRLGEIDSTEKSDPDLAAHFMVTKKRGVAWRGLPIDEVFSEIPKEFYSQSLLYDFKDLNKNVILEPAYGILNACRTVAYIKDGMVFSKKEGGEWALKNFDERYFPIVKQALLSYHTGERFPELSGGTRDSFLAYLEQMVE